jgi:hypothetical protein
MIIGSFTEHIPPAARTLAIAGSVYGILRAAKTNDWVIQYINGWIAVAFNLMLTILGIVILVPSDQLYTTNTLVTVITGVLTSSGIHGMSKNIPPTKG